MAWSESTACGRITARGRRDDPAAYRRIVAAGAVAIALVLAAGCGGGSDRNDVPASPIGGGDAGTGLPSQDKLERRSAQARRQAEKLEAQLKRTKRAAKRASK